MNRWIMLPLLSLLTACVSYYQPESALEDGVYYAEADPAYHYNSDDYYYSRVVVYPWSSLDNFYFGYWPYPSYGFGHWPYPGYSFSFVYPDEPGFAAGYYAFYSPWYWRGYSTYYAPVWRPYRQDCDHHGRCAGHDHKGQGAGDDSYAGDDGQNNAYAGGGGEENAFYSNNVKNKMGRAGYPPTKRYVSKTAAGHTAYQGRAVKSNEPTKAGKSRTKPVYSVSQGSAPGTHKAKSASVSSGQNTRSTSFGSPSHTQSSGHGKSSRQRDRD